MQSQLLAPYLAEVRDRAGHRSVQGDRGPDPHEDDERLGEAGEDPRLPAREGAPAGRGGQARHEEGARRGKRVPSSNAY